MPPSVDLWTRDRSLLRSCGGLAVWLCLAVFAALSLGASVQAQTMSVGNVVFSDANANGHYDAGEGVGDVRVELWRVTSDPEVPVVMADTQQTLSSGAYLFTGIASGTYYVTIPVSEFASGKPLFGTTSLPGSQLSGDDDAGEDGLDTFDPAITGVSTMEFVVAPGFGATDSDVETGYDHAADNATDDNVDLTIDFGFFHPVGVGNLVFVDLNANGVADANEGVAGVAVQLFLSTDNPLTAASLSDVVTDAAGHYWFGGLLQGSYRVFIPPSQFGPGGPLQGALSMTGVGAVGDDDNATGVGHSSDDGVDNALPATNGIASGAIVLAPGVEPIAATGETGSASTDDDGLIDADNDFTVDFGFSLPAGKVGVGNLVFIDYNLDGVANDGEGAQGVTVKLFQQGDDPLVDAPIATQVTQSDGRYLFANLDPGSYFLYVPKEAFAPNQPLFSALSVVASAAGDDGLGEDGVDTPFPEITGVSGGVFTLAVGACPTASTVGNAENGYGSSADDFHDADVDLTRDLGFKVRASQPFTIGNLVFFDMDHDGKFGVGDTGIEGVEVRLYHEGDVAGVNTPVLTTHTAANGTYLFTGLTPGRYVVHVPAVEFNTGRPLVGMLSISGNGSDNDSDDDVDENGIDSATPDASGISSTVIELTENNEPVETGAFATQDDDIDRNGNVTVDFGFSPDCPVLTISPPVLPSVVRGDPYSVTLTLAGGSGETWSLASGSLPAGLTLSASGVLAGTPTVSGSASFTIKATLPNSCSAAQSFTLVVEAPAVMGVGNAVYADANGNGVFDANEGLPNVTLQLFREGVLPLEVNAIATQQTDAFGVYAFTALQPGRYFVHVPAGNFQNGGPLYQKVSSTDASADDGVDDQVSGNDNGIDALNPASSGVSSGVFELVEGGEPTDADTELGVNAAADNANDANFDSTVDFAFVSSPAVTVAIGNLVYRDLNNNQVYDAGEGVSNVKIQLFNSTDNVAAATPLRTTTTAVGGRYLFGALEPGAYKVFVPASEFARGAPLYGCLSIPNAGSGTAGDDNADENGIDASTPASTGIVSTNVVLALGTAPTMAPGVETGFDAASDDATDGNSNLTVDLGFAVDCHTILIAPDTLSDGQLGTAYDVTFNATGGVGPYSYSLAFGTLPPGLALFGRGAISGTPTSIGTFAFGVTVTDDYGCSSVQGYQLVIASRPLAVGNLIFFDSNGNGHADEGEGVDGVTVQIYTATQTVGVDAPVKSATTSGGGRWLIDELQPDSYRVHVPAAMFASGAPLWMMRSMSGVLTSGDDDMGEDGEDALDPTTSGVSTGSFALYPGTMPAGASESGLSGTSDDARDIDIDLTRDLGFVDVTGLPSTFSSWQSSYSLSGSPTANTDGDADNNLMEYAFVGNPTSGASASAAFSLTEDQPTTRMTALIRRRHGGQSDLTYTLQLLPNLAQSPAGWVSTTVVPTATNNGDGTETLAFANVDVDAVLNGSTLGFARVLVALDANHDTIAEATATSAVLGWQHRTLAVQHQTFGAAFTKPSVFTGAVGAVNGSTLDVTASVGAGSVVGSLTAGLSYYVEVIGGDNEGQRWEVDESATTATSIVVLPANALSTQATVPTSLVGDLIAVRPHWRVVDLFPPADYHATGSAATADQLLLWNPATTGYITLYLNTVSGNKTWLKFGGVGLNIQDNTIIGPIDGTFARPRVGTVTSTTSGQVRTWKCAFPLKTGLSFVGNPYPVAQSFVDRVMTVAGGFTGGGAVNAADRINYWNGDASAAATYSVYYLFKSATLERWLRFGQVGGVDHANDKLFAPGTGFFITSIAGHPTWVLPVPWTP